MKTDLETIVQQRNGSSLAKKAALAATVCALAFSAIACGPKKYSVPDYCRQEYAVPSQPTSLEINLSTGTLYALGGGGTTTITGYACPNRRIELSYTAEGDLSDTGFELEGPGMEYLSIDGKSDSFSMNEVHSYKIILNTGDGGEYTLMLKNKKPLSQVQFSLQFSEGIWTVN